MQPLRKAQPLKFCHQQTKPDTMHHYLCFTSLVKNGGEEYYCLYLKDWKLVTKVVFDEGFAVIGEKKKKHFQAFLYAHTRTKYAQCY